MKLFPSIITVIHLVLLGVIGIGGYRAFQMLEARAIASEAAAAQTKQEVTNLLSEIETRVETPRGKIPFVTLTVDSEHTITRTVIDSEFAKGITWNIIRNGVEVLSRNAKNETKYQYFANTPGLYTVYVTAVIDGAYRVISNVVFYEVEQSAEQGAAANP